jgi:hypothetical protein
MGKASIQDKKHNKKMKKRFCKTGGRVLVSHGKLPRQLATVTAVIRL